MMPSYLQLSIIFTCLYSFICIYTWAETCVHGHCSSYPMLNAVESFPQELTAAGLGEVLTGDISFWSVCWQVSKAMVKMAGFVRSDGEK